MPHYTNEYAKGGGGEGGGEGGEEGGEGEKYDNFHKNDMRNYQ